MADAHTATQDDVAQLERLRLSLVAKVWPTALEAARTSDHEIIRELVRLKVDIEAIDFALAHRPGHAPA